MFKGLDMATAPLAILGYGCRLPGGIVDGPSCWEALIEGRDLVTVVPKDRFNTAAYYSARTASTGKATTKWGGFIDRIDEFEPSCFGISPREAPNVDPQHRILLETLWEALEMAGLPASSLAKSRTGVFVGMSTADFTDLQRGHGHSRSITPFTGQGSSHCIAANRLSYCLDLRGPSFAIDTACSSALVAIDRAAKSLENGECDLALAGGVNALLTPDVFVIFSVASMLSPDGRCKAFDASGNGFVRSEGGGMFVLKRLDRAIADGDPIQAVLVGYGTNQDGHTNGITMPNSESQEDLLRDVYRAAEIDPATVGYIEAHGTGTMVGDPAEAFALGRMFRDSRTDDRPLVVGSIKSNMGHLESASGVASLMKAIQMVRRHRVPPNLHFNTPNPNIPFDDLRIRIPTKLEEWPTGAAKLVGINSFGFGGANAHVIVAETPTPPKRKRTSPSTNGKPEPAREFPLVISGRSQQALDELIERWIEKLDVDDSAFRDLAYTATCRREHYDHRLTVLAADAPSARAALQNAKNFEPISSVVPTQKTSAELGVAFVFCGQGPQWHAMGMGLFHSEPTFRSSMEEIDRLIVLHGGWSLLEELAKDEATSRIALTSFGQPALFALHVSLARLWESWGVRPAVTLGHSVGEIAAAHVSGLLSLEDAVRIIVHRGRCLQDHALPGGMAAVALSEEAARQSIASAEGLLHVAAVNSPEMVTVAGDPVALDRAAASWESQGVWWRRLRVQHAFHTPLVDPAQAPFRDAIGAVANGKPQCPMIATVTGKEAVEGGLNEDYWWSNIRQPVRFADAISEVASRGIQVFLEIGPQPVLASNIRQSVGSNRHWSYPSLKRGDDERRTMLASAAGLSAIGAPVQWSAFFPELGECVDVPRHPWSRERFWHEEAEHRRILVAKDYHRLLGQERPGSQPSWQGMLSLAEFPWLADHKVGARTIAPASAFIEICLAAATRQLNAPQCVIDGFVINRPLVLADDVIAQTQTIIDAGQRNLVFASRVGESDDAWSRHFVATFRPLTGAPPALLDLSLWDGADETSAEAFYSEFQSLELPYGPAFQGVLHVRRRKYSALAEIALPSSAAEPGADFHAHPALLDACFQTLLEAVPKVRRDNPQTYLPERCGKVSLFAKLPERVWSEVRVREANDVYLNADIVVYSPEGTPLAAFEDFRCRATTPPRQREIASCFYQAGWQSKPLAEPSSRELANATPVAELLAAALQSASALWHDRPSDVLSREDALIEELAQSYFADYVVSLGLNPAARVDVDALVANGRLSAERREWFERCLNAFDRGADAGRIRERWRRGLTVSTETYPRMRLLELASRSLPRWLDGDEQPDSFRANPAVAELIEHCRHERVAARMANAAVQYVVRRLLQETPASRPLRVLEINGGGGGLARAILPCLPPRRTEYVFTDRDATALAAAEDRFRRFEFVKFQQWTVGETDVPSGRFDVILAVDDASDPRTAEEVRGQLHPLLNPGGILIDRTQPRKGLESLLVAGPTFVARDEPKADSVWSDKSTRVVAEGGDTLTISRSMIGHGERAATVEPDFKDVAKQWLVLCDADGVGVRFADRLSAAGLHVVRAHASNRFEAADRDVHFDPTKKEDFERLRDFCDFGAEPYAAANFLPLDLDDELQPTLEDVDFAESHACHSFLHLLQTFALAPSTPPICLMAFTRGARELATNMTAGGANQAALLGLARVAATEFQPLSIQLIDGGPNDDLAEIGIREAVAPDREEEVVYRDGERFVPRLESTDVRSTTFAPDGTPFEIAIGRPGDLDGIHLKELHVPPPGPGEIQIDVHLAALNFLDLLRALGNLPAEGLRRVELGDECAGVVRAVGEGVVGYAVGDRVLGANTACFRSRINQKASVASKLPAEVSLVGGATMTVVYGTVLLGVRDVASLQPGETLLIHSAAGGVGLAALHYARAIGAKVIATVGSPAKRDLLEKYEPDGLFNSRDLSFFDDVMAATEKRGVDVVLNSLAGQAMVRSLNLLAPGGRFIEIGKRDFYEQTRVALWPLRRNASFHGVELGTFMEAHPDRASRNFAELLTAAAERGEQIPPLPTRTFPAARAGDALRLLSQGAHIGKFVIDLAESWGQIRAKLPPLKVEADATYVITGAFGGVGFDLAKWLASRGARHLALFSRSGPPTDAARQALAELRSQGVVAEDVRCDVADDRALANSLIQIRESMPPIRGVFHPAMVLDDGMIANLDAERFSRVYRPKVRGAWNLHRLTKDDPLDHFVLFSSVSAWFGNFGQANYSAANSALEALSHHRQAQGLPSSTVAWGVLGDIGYVAGREELGQQLAQYGLTPITAADVRTGLELAIGSRQPVSLVVRVDWPRLARKTRGGRTDGWVLSELMTDAEGGASLAGAELRSAILAADPGQRLAMIVEAVRELAAKVLGMSAQKLDCERPLASLGLDSLMGVELASLIEGKLGVSVPLNAISRDVTINKLAQVVLPALGGGDATTKSAPARGKKVGEPTTPTLAGKDGMPACFFIHPAGGDLFIYQDLAERLGSSAHVVGVESRMLDGESPEFDTLKEMGDAYAKLIVAKDAKGPYRLFGFSFGGLLALETAVSLQQMGKTVEWIGLVEADHLRVAYDGDPTERIAKFFVEIVQHLQSSLQVFEGLPIERLRSEAPDVVRRMMSDAKDSALVDWLLQYVPSDGPTEIVADYARRVAAHIRVMGDQNRRRPHGVQVFNWRATAGLSASLPAEGEPLLPGERLEWLEGEHFAPMLGDRTAELVERLAGLMESGSLVANQS
jgi:acyl transferase domain-containing protein/NADPH:quinone reductase-like Zn-dependent oxidoreductase/acyl carrier protein/NADP-dependent 3-hydroxy acid dehydrogenase YdfG